MSMDKFLASCTFGLVVFFFIVISVFSTFREDREKEIALKAIENGYSQKVDNDRVIWVKQ